VTVRSLAYCRGCVPGMSLTQTGGEEPSPGP
jgi:hypothetical protein